MAVIRPFRGAYYSAERVGGLEAVVGPPYDVISPEEQAALYARSPHNYVRVMLNRPEPGDDPRTGPYERAAGFLREWLASGVLQQDDQPAFWLYRQEFANPADGRRAVRTGLFCALKLEPYASGVVLPHEETRPGAREDRLRLMRATRANPEPIFALFEDPGLVVDRAAGAAADVEPTLAARVGADTHALWRLTDPEALAAIPAALQDRPVWIADGHHRYETALAYRDERRAAEGVPAGELRAYDYLLVVLAPFSDPGIVVLPTHRLIRNVPLARLEQLPLQLERYFTMAAVPVERVAQGMAPEPGAEHRIGMVGRDGAWVLTLRDESVMDAAVEGHSPVWKRLDVSILQALALDRSLGIPPAALATTPDVGYTRDRDDAIARVRSGEYQLAFLLNLPSAEEVRQVAAAGDRMPAKSTYFYPKLWSGLLLRLLE